MPLFECENCGNIDNTALTTFWKSLRDGTPRLCSACDPDTKAWHGKFPAKKIEAYQPGAVEYPARGDK